MENDILAEILLTLKNNVVCEEKSQTMEDCPICLESLILRYTMKLPCGHEYCRNCVLRNILEHDNLFCPCCKQYKSPPIRSLSPPPKASSPEEDWTGFNFNSDNSDDNQMGVNMCNFWGGT